MPGISYETKKVLTSQKELCCMGREVEGYDLYLYKSRSLLLFKVLNSSLT
jgi:hypothetical protein